MSASDGDVATASSGWLFDFSEIGSQTALTVRNHLFRPVVVGVCVCVVVVVVAAVFVRFVQVLRRSSGLGSSFGFQALSAVVAKI